MPAYRYAARDIRGRAYTGTVVAASEQAARKKLRDRQLYTTELGGMDEGLLRTLLRLVKPS